MSKRTMNPRARVDVDTYRDDRWYPRVAQAAEELLAKGHVVAPVDVLVHMGLLKRSWPAFIRPTPSTSTPKTRSR
jgi:hypothetical protein